MALEKEVETYHARLPELKEHAGKYVLIHGDKVVDFFTSYEDAIKAGYQQFQLQPFLVKLVQAVEQVHFVSRLFAPLGLRSSA